MKSPAPAESGRAPGEPRRLRVLLVDDNVPYLESLNTLLAEYPEVAVVGTAETGADGIALARRLSPDVVLLDLVMPDVSGWRVASELKVARPDVGVVILSSHDSAAHRRAARDVGALFVSKSDVARDLRAAIRLQAPVAWALALVHATSGNDEAEAPRREVLNLLLGATCDLTLFLDEAHRIEFASTAAERILARPPAALCGQSVFEVVHPDDVARLDAVLASEEPPSSASQVRFRGQGESWRLFETRCARVTLGDFDQIVLTGRVQDHERMVAELRQSEERFRQLTEAIDQVFWLTEARTRRVLYVSPAYETIWQRTCQSLLSEPMSWLEAVDPADRERVAAALERLNADGVYDVEYRIVRPDGGVRWIRDRGFTILDEAGAVSRWAGTATDITERRQLEQRLEGVQTLELVGRMAASIAHDFSNMLTVIAFNASLIAQEAWISPETTEVASELIEAVDRAKGLTQQLTAFGARHSNNVLAQPQALEIGSAMTRLVRLFERVLGSDVTARCFVGEHVPTITFAPSDFDQVLMNLLVNARDAMPNGGTIDVRVAGVAAVDLRVPGHARAAAHYAVLTVEDSGEGIAGEYLARIFDPFFTTKEPGKGTGIGLATVYSLVRAAHGWIEVDSERGVGSSFRVYWPGIEADTRV